MEVLASLVAKIFAKRFPGPTLCWSQPIDKPVILEFTPRMSETDAR